MHSLYCILYYLCTIPPICELRKDYISKCPNATSMLSYTNYPMFLLLLPTIPVLFNAFNARYIPTHTYSVSSVYTIYPLYAGRTGRQGTYSILIVYFLHPRPPTTRSADYRSCIYTIIYLYVMRDHAHL